MHLVPDIGNKNGCLILVTLQRFKYRTNPNGATLYTETSETLKLIETHFYHCWHALKSIAHNYSVGVSVLLPICCHIDLVMTYCRSCPIINGQWLINGCKHLSVVGIRTQAMTWSRLQPKYKC